MPADAGKWGGESFVGPLFVQQPNEVLGVQLQNTGKTCSCARTALGTALLESLELSTVRVSGDTPNVPTRDPPACLMQNFSHKRIHRRASNLGFGNCPS